MAWFYGRQSVKEILKSGQTALKVLLATSVQKEIAVEIGQLAHARAVKVERVAKEVLNARFHGNHQGVAVEVATVPTAEARDFKSFLAEWTPEKKSFVCLFDEVQDPQNLGAMIRSAACFGCDAVILPQWRSARLTDAVMKSSSGAAAHIPIIEIANLTVAVERLKSRGFFIYGADPQADQELGHADFAFPLALIMGNEHRGIKPVLKKMCDGTVRIPQTQAVASLNVSVSAGIFFYEIARSRAK